MENNLKWTGERVVPECMSGGIRVYQHHLARYNFSLMYARKKHVLDASSGSGFGTNILFDVAESIVGVDISKDAINYAREKYNGTFEICDLEKDFPDKKFDMVISFETIEHLENPETFLRNVRENSKGFFFSIPINDSSQFHKVVYSVEDVKNLIKDNFDNCEVRWISQRGLNFFKGTENAKYLIGYVLIE